MGNEEADTSSKTSKSSSAQENPPPSSPATVFPDWAAVQAYYNSAGGSPIPPPGFYHSPVASSPQGPPYMWGPQPVIPPYGPPPPYVTMYPHGGIYSHPSIPMGSHPYRPYAVPSSNGTAEASVAIAGGVHPNGKNNEIGKASGASANGGVSPSGGSGSQGSSEGSDVNSPEISGQRQGHELGHVDGEAQNGSIAGSTSITATRAPATNNAALVAIPSNDISGPTTTLNIGMDYWGGSSSSSTPLRSKLPVKPANTAMVQSSLSSSRDGVPLDLWIKDEREIKRQKRKLSNRESARRSRLRKQTECEELAQRVGTLKEENDMLKEELRRTRDECEKFASENASLTERLKKLQGEETKLDEGCARVNGPNSDITEKDK